MTAPHAPGTSAPPAGFLLGCAGMFQTALPGRGRRFSNSSSCWPRFRCRTRSAGCERDDRQHRDHHHKYADRVNAILLNLLHRRSTRSVGGSIPGHALGTSRRRLDCYDGPRSRPIAARAVGIPWAPSRKLPAAHLYRNPSAQSESPPLISLHNSDRFHPCVSAFGSCASRPTSHRHF